MIELYLEQSNPNIPEEEQKKIADFFVQLVLKIEQGDKEALNLLNLPQDQLLQHIKSQNLQQEAFENIRSRVGATLKGTDPATQRYQMFLKSIQKKLWELGQDIQSTKDQNNISQYQNLIQQIQKIEWQAYQLLLLTATISGILGSWLGNYWLKKVTLSTLQFGIAWMLMLLSFLLALGIL